MLRLKLLRKRKTPSKSLYLIGGGTPMIPALPRKDLTVLSFEPDSEGSTSKLSHLLKKLSDGYKSNGYKVKTLIQENLFIPN